MQHCEQDIFRQAVEKAKEGKAWERLAAPQKAELVTKYLLSRFGGPAVKK